MSFWTPNHFSNGGFIKPALSFFIPTTVSGLVLAASSRYNNNLFDSNTAPTTYSQLTDASGNGNHIIQGSKLLQPLWDTSTSPYAGAKFDGDTVTTNADWMSAAHSASLNLSTTLTGFAIVSAPTLQNVSFANIFRKWDNGTAIGWLLEASSGSTGAILVVNNTQTVFSGNPLGANKVLLSFVINNGATKAYVNGGSPVTGSYTVGSGFANTQPVVIGARNNGNTAFKGYGYEFLIYSGDLTATSDFETVRSGLNATWGIY